MPTTINVKFSTDTLFSIQPNTPYVAVAINSAPGAWSVTVMPVPEQLPQIFILGVGVLDGSYVLG